MTQEEKSLLLKDLCARLPYGVKVHVINDTFYEVREPYDTNINYSNFHLFTGNKLIIKPYLRPKSSMTEIEHMELKAAYDNGFNGLFDEYSHIDWLNSHHFDYRNLIKKKLAVEAPEGMYK